MKNLHEQLTGKPHRNVVPHGRPVFHSNEYGEIPYSTEGLDLPNGQSDSSADDQLSQEATSSSASQPSKTASPQSNSSARYRPEPSALAGKAQQQNPQGSNKPSAQAAKPKPQARAKAQHRLPATGTTANNTHFVKSGKQRKTLGRSNDQHQIKSVIRDRFELKRKLGAGGMGTIYKAVDQIMVEAHDKNPYIAIKILREELKHNPEAFKALQREYRKAQKLAHPNIVQVYDFDRDGDLIYMTMEFLEGKDLERVLRKFRDRGLPFAKAFSIIEDICDALIHAHANKYIHYDFKPGNIFITNQGLSKVFDFGISRAVKQNLHNVKPKGDETCFEPTTFTALTPTYASPEMINGDTADTRDDIYALAVVTYEILAGVHPFDRLPANEAQRRELVPKRIPGLSTRQWKTLLAALSFEREERLPTVEAFREGMLNSPSDRQVYRRSILGACLLTVAGFQAFAIFDNGSFLAQMIDSIAPGISSEAIAQPAPVINPGSPHLPGSSSQRVDAPSIERANPSLNHPAHNSPDLNNPTPKSPVRSPKTDLDPSDPVTPIKPILAESHALPQHV